MIARVLVPLLVLAASVLAARVEELQPGTYLGTLEVPGAPVELALHFERTVSGWSGRLDIPSQSVSDLPLSSVVVGPDALSFGSSALSAEFALTPDGEGWRGTMTQRGQRMPFRLRALAEGETVGPRRPQTPQPPYPYDVQDVRVPNEADGVVLAGTFTRPRGDGPHPAVVLMTGSGPQDRDETIAGHKPFLVLADALTRAGVAVLRMDDRGMGASTGDFMNATGHDFIRDASAGLDWLAVQPGIDADRLGLVGHSEGGGLAPFVATARDDVAFLVTLAGSLVSGRELMPRQLEAIMRAAGAPDAVVEQQLELQGRMLDLCLERAPRAELRDVTRELILVQSGLPSLEGLPPAVLQQFDQAMDAQVGQLDNDWMRGFLSLDAREPLSTLTIPILALNGGLDLQVLPDQNLGAAREAAERAGNTRLVTREFEGLNHLFQLATTGLIDEYAQIEQTMAPEVLQVITDWVREQTGLE